MKRKFLVALFIAVLLDLADFFLFGWIPIAGDALDVVGLLILFPFIGTTAFLAALELVPTFDFLPFFTGAVVLSRKKLQGGNKHVR